MSFLNLSNHPIKSWPYEQLCAAQKFNFGEIKEFEGGLSPIDPTFSEKEIKILATKIAEAAFNKKVKAAFVATDFTFLYALVFQLKKLGIRCFAATSSRSVIENKKENGEIVRQSVFSFVQWREYL